MSSVVAYSFLSSDPRLLRFPLLVTVGSPLALRAIRVQFRPLRYPTPVSSWYNAFDTRLPGPSADRDFSNVKNHTNNRHGLIGYLDDPAVAKKILDALGA